MKYRSIKYMTGYAIQRKVLWWWEYLRDNEPQGSMLVEGNPPLEFATKELAEIEILFLLSKKSQNE